MQNDCKEWIGLEPPESYTCERDAFHPMPHRATVKGVRRRPDIITPDTPSTDLYVEQTATLEWET